MILPRNFWILTHLRIWEVSQILQIFQNFCFPFGKRFFESLRLPLAKGSSTSHPDQGWNGDLRVFVAWRMTLWLYLSLLQLLIATETYGFHHKA